MKARLLLTTAVGLVFATAAFAQSPRDTQIQTPSTTAPATQKAPDTTTRQTPSNSSSTTAPTSTGGSQAQTAPATSSQPSGTPAPAQAETNAPPASNNQAQQAPASGSPATTAQQPNQPANPPTNTAQQPAQPANPPTNTAQQPTNPPANTAQSSSTTCVTLRRYQRPAANAGHSGDYTPERAACDQRELLALGGYGGSRVTFACKRCRRTSWKLCRNIADTASSSYATRS